MQLVFMPRLTALIIVLLLQVIIVQSASSRKSNDKSNTKDERKYQINRDDIGTLIATVSPDCQDEMEVQLGTGSLDNLSEACSNEVKKALIKMNVVVMPDEENPTNMDKKSNSKGKSSTQAQIEGANPILSIIGFVMVCFVVILIYIIFVHKTQNLNKNAKVYKKLSKKKMEKQRKSL